MIRWKYMVALDLTLENLNYLGSLGWELVAIMQGETRKTFYLKCELGEI